jgi:hypothetical protein
LISLAWWRQKFQLMCGPLALRYKGFWEEGNIGLRHYSSSKYLFLLDSIISFILNFHKTPQRTEQTSSLLKSQEICLSHMCWTMFKYSQVECKNWQLCCLHFWICGQVFGKGWMHLFFYDDFWILKDIKSYPENYNFKIHLKFIVVNNMHRTNPKFPNKKVNIFWNSTKASCVHMSSILTYLLYYMSQTFMNRALLLVHENKSFTFSRDTQQGGIHDGDVFFN